MKLLIVESPTKAKTITKFLPQNYRVESCFGHIRDLPQSAKDIPAKYKAQAWASLGVDVAHDFKPLYVIPSDKKKVVTALKKSLQTADELYLATDEDREGESISWHLTEVLNPKIPVKRLVFHEITKEAIANSLTNPRIIDTNLVRAQEARRILDRLVGYSLSPLLWQKIAYGLSAGRVQSVAVRLICERELERMRFKVSKYLKLTATLNKDKQDFEARLLCVAGTPIAQGADFDPETGSLLKEKEGKVKVFSLPELETLKAKMRAEAWLVVAVEKKPITRRPWAPFITSTLQQDASRKFGWPSRKTMQVAQKLYERGYITYMRTDSTILSSQALKAARLVIAQEFGDQYLPKDTRVYGHKKIKGAQEAHEAIRPAGSSFRSPQGSGLAGDQYKLYNLIWQRTVASQMVDARQERTSVDIQVAEALFRASGTITTFPGFLQVYQKGTDIGGEEEGALPALAQNDKLDCKSLEISEHETKPPACYTEASLIKVLESEGVGRPSTYASIMGTIEDRGYVHREGNTLKPTFTAMIVSNLLTKHFPDLVDVRFTAGMEQSLDDIAAGDKDHLEYLHQFYDGSAGLEGQIAKQEKAIEPEEARALTFDEFKDYVFKVGRYGAYVCRVTDEQKCASIPEASAPAEVTVELIEKMLKQKEEGGESLGTDPVSGEKVYVLTGRYGPYLQLGSGEFAGTQEAISQDKAESALRGKQTDESARPEAKVSSVKAKVVVEKGARLNKKQPTLLKPKRASIPKSLAPEKLTLEQALYLLSLPRTLGEHPELKKEVKFGIGRFGPYVVCAGDYRSLKRDDDIFTINLARALELLSEPKKGRGGRKKAVSKPLKELGEHPDDKKPIVIKDGRYGPYVNWGKVNASLPKDTQIAELTLPQALALLAKKEKKTS